MPKFIISEDDATKIIKLYSEKVSPSDIVARFGYKRTTIVALLKRARILRSRQDAGILAYQNGKKDKAVKALILSAKTYNRFNPLKACFGERSGKWIKDRSKLKFKRSMTECREWSRLVKERDNFTCMNCSIVGGELESHHIKSYAEYPELRFDINNGITLCVDCHRLTDGYANRGRKINKNQYSYV